MTTADDGALDARLAEQIDRHDRALERRDVPGLEVLLAENYVQISPLGLRRDKGQWFAWFEDVVRYEQMRREVYDSRSFLDAAVVLSKCSAVMRVRGGEPSVHTALMLEVWTNRDGTWRKAVEQLTRPPQNAPAADTRTESS